MELLWLKTYLHTVCCWEECGRKTFEYAQMWQDWQSAVWQGHRASGNRICSSATTWVDCGLVGMYFLFYINFSFSAVNILKGPVAPQGSPNWDQYPSYFHLQLVIIIMCVVSRVLHLPVHFNIWQSIFKPNPMLWCYVTRQINSSQIQECVKKALSIKINQDVCRVLLGR